MAIVEYNGASYAGFQRQSSLSTVQGALETALHKVSGERVTVAGAGRTDSGAHAVGQVLGFTIDTRLDDNRLLEAVNGNLPHDIALQAVRTVGPDFDPRRNAVSREYHYLVLNRQHPSPLWRGRAHHVRRKLDLDVMREMATRFVGVHDFRGFTGSSEAASTTREIFGLVIEHDHDILRFRVTGSGFLHQMIRSIVGSILWVGSGVGTMEAVEMVLGRSTSGALSQWSIVPAFGLYLVRVSYPAEHASGYCVGLDNKAAMVGRS